MLSAHLEEADPVVFNIIEKVTYLASVWLAQARNRSSLTSS
jgi:hypothetical protein